MKIKLLLAFAALLAVSFCARIVSRQYPNAPVARTTAVPPKPEPAKPVPQKPAAVPGLDRSPGKQAKRADFIKRLQATDYIGDVSGPKAGIVSVFVKPSFMVGDYKDKANVISVIYGYYFDGTNTSETVYLRDSRSGNGVGTFNSMRGLKMDWHHALSCFS
jgi:hypothetical protein